MEFIAQSVAKNLIKVTEQQNTLLELQIQQTKLQTALLKEIKEIKQTLQDDQ